MAKTTGALELKIGPVVEEVTTSRDGKVARDVSRTAPGGGCFPPKRILPCSTVLLVDLADAGDEDARRATAGRLAWYEGRGWAVVGRPAWTRGQG